MNPNEPTGQDETTAGADRESAGASRPAVSAQDASPVTGAAGRSVTQTGGPSFWVVPLRGPYPAPMTLAGDYIASAGIVVFAISLFFMPWITIGVKDVLGLTDLLGIKAPSAGYGLFESPWAWVLVGVLVVMLCGMYFVQTRGALVLASGIFCVLFSVLFYVGAWQKINSIIGDVLRLARSLPIIGEALGEMLLKLSKEYLSVHVAAGWWMLFPAAVLLIVGASLRLAAEPSRPEVSAL